MFLQGCSTDYTSYPLICIWYNKLCKRAIKWLLNKRRKIDMDFLQFIFFASFFIIIVFHYLFNRLFRNMRYKSFFTVLCSCLAMVLFVFILNFSLQYFAYPNIIKDEFSIMSFSLLLYSILAQLIYIVVLFIIAMMKRLFVIYENFKHR